MNEVITLVPPSAPCLRKPAIEVSNISDIETYIAPMRQLMLENNGVGLAAPQCGIGLRFFLTNTENFPVVVNPKILGVYGYRISAPEGCLTWPGRTTFVPRREAITAEWTDMTGESRISIIRGVEARIFQHEMDHLNGVCIF